MNEFRVTSTGQIVAVDYKDFWLYVQKKGVTREDILKLTADKKKEFFLKWKHGLNDPKANEDIEQTKQLIYSRDMQVPLHDIPEDFRESVRSHRLFEDYCIQIKREIGLFHGGPKLDQSKSPVEVAEVAKAFGGDVIHYTEV